ncbi:hypothetical protein L2E82_21001 [Cichorium intybus]|uniref:Uncharacterized protein n=1 Tax=Cichorium intybus TaxID=13427 RepID=A0ACB9DUW9_CICIN|nr:hypothetical protein L2E82_21001 [Cichorium intybus]
MEMAVTVISSLWTSQAFQNFSHFTEILRKETWKQSLFSNPTGLSSPRYLRTSSPQWKGIIGNLSFPKNAKQPIRIYLNYDAVGHSPARDCRKVGDIVKLGEPPAASNLDTPSCNPRNDPPIYGDCWYNCTSDDIAGEDKRHRLRRALGQTADWFKRALAVEPVRGNLS